MGSAPTFEKSASVRDYLIHALRLDLIGPSLEDEAYQHEGLQFAPSKWYMTGFLVPTGAPIEQRAQDTEEEQDEPSEPSHGADDAAVPERGSGKRVFLPSSLGLSVLVHPTTTALKLAVTWGDYAPEELSEEAYQGQPTRRRPIPWRRIPCSAELTINLASVKLGEQVLEDIPGSNGLEIAYLFRNTTVQQAEEKKVVRAVSIFVVNHRTPAKKNELQDETFAFQVHMTVTADHPFIPRYDPRGLESDDWDDRLSNLHYRDAAEYAVGHNVSVNADVDENHCYKVHTEWMPQAAVERVEPSQIPNVEFEMDVLGKLRSAEAARLALNPLVDQYQDWIAEQHADAQRFSGNRREVADELVRRAAGAASRIQAGIDLLKDAELLDAFCTANRAMAAAARRRIAQEQNRSPDAVPPLKWRPFQLAYILMNLRGVANPTHIERETVDLLFFPTGGGKTEAYLGLAAFTMVLRRLRSPVESGYRGLSVLMRYTLRLLTLDQLGRAAALICALELEREKNPERLGRWPFEIALWVGRAATPNYMGKKGDSSPNTARARTMRFKNDSSKDPPLPLDCCPWCGTKFNKHSFRLYPNPNEPKNLHVSCARRACDFSGKRRLLPIVAVDEPIYERLPALMIATVDKFAAMPWSGETARFFQGLDPDNPQPPDLIIQDELHLISGPLGTMVGLYETAIDHLCLRHIDGQEVRPKIIASTATVRLARKQIRALFGRSTVEVFPPPGIDRRDSFFAEHVSRTKKNPRLYLGISAQGRGPKVVFLKSIITLMAAAQLAWEAAEERAGPNPADPYMTVVAYFNALRELGSARRITEDEVRSRLLNYQGRTRLGELRGLFMNRQIDLEPVELTSRVGTAKVAEAKRKLSLGFHERERVDVALATNMISVGLDITRLGLMVVSGQPKSTSEYIQATSRVGRDPDRPGLVVTLLNLHRPRDRSHYEHFSAWHESFYRGVEATSVTPFSPRALDRGLPAVTVALARLGIPELTPMLKASRVEHYSTDTSSLAKAVGERARIHKEAVHGSLINHVSSRTQSLIDDWAVLAHKAGDDGVTFGYARRGRGVNTPLLREMIDPDRDKLNPTQLQFRAPRSLRDVEPGVLLVINSPEED